jgi:pyridinium-3,5-bisthiocarboxylic acid mononucleotide nickel chelatase
MIAYFDCLSGISGDMTLAALVDAGADREYLVRQVASLPLEGVSLSFAEVRRHGLRGQHLTVTHPPQHQHRHLKDILRIIGSSGLTADEQRLAGDLFDRLAAAEAAVHGTTVEKVHFHEVGAIDSIVDLCVAVCQLGIRDVYASPVSTGCGTITIAHGAVPVPAPATAWLMRDMPLRATTIEAELTTPTGAAILSVLKARFSGMPAMRLASVGLGAGTRDLPMQANLLRVLVGHPTAGSAATPTIETDTILVLTSTLDDASGEQLGQAQERLLGAPGVLDVFLQPMQMKKNRPGVELTVLCDPAVRNEVEGLIFASTTTLGIRCCPAERHKLKRAAVEVCTAYGTIRGKTRWLPDGSVRFKPEASDCARIALETGMAVDEVAQIASLAWRESQP